MLALLLLAAACARSAASDALPPLASRSPTPSPSASSTPVAKVPNVVGMAYAKAKAALVDKGFAVKKATKYTSSVDAGHVVSQSKEAGSVLPEGTVVKLTVAVAFPSAVNGNPWGYNFVCCKKIFDPPSDFCSFFTCVSTFHNGTGYVVQCEDGQYSLTGGEGHSTCFSHDGYDRTLFDPE
jgi:PASTA domain